MEWLVCLLCISFGAALLVLVQALFVFWYIWNTPEGTPIPEGKPPEFQLPKSVDHIGLYSDNGDCAAAVSLTLQFLFQELKHSPDPLAWIHRKLHQELVDLLTRTTSGKLFESLAIRSISTGDSAPCIRWAGVQNVETYSEGRIKTLDILLDIYYSGGFRIAIDAGILLGKTACIDIEVEQLSGRARIRFATQPFTHWSLSFLSAPQLELCARPLRGRLAALLQAHARRALQKRHTLPNYSIRFKPFFTKPDPGQLEMPIEEATFKLEGKFEITILEITRLFLDAWPAKENRKIYCSLSLDSSTWISCRLEDNFYIFTLDIVINKDKTQQLGTVFKQINCGEEDNKAKTQVVIETVVPLSAAYRADLRRDDVVIAVDNKLVSTMSQVVKTVKSINRACFTMRIERKTPRKNTPGDHSGAEESKKAGKNTAQLEINQKQEKSKPFSFRKMSDVLDSARSVGQEGKALLRNAHSNWNIQDMEKKSDIDISQDTKNTTLSKSRTKTDDASLSSLNSVKQAEASQPSFGFGLRKRRCSVENKTSSDSSTSSTPTASSPGTPSKRNEKSSSCLHHQNRSSIDDGSMIAQTPPKICVISTSNGQRHLETGTDDFEELVMPDEQSESGQKENKDEQSVDSSVENNSAPDLFQTQSSGLMPANDVTVCHESMRFALNQNQRFININVWGKSSDGAAKDVLLAYLNIPLLAILQDCYNSKISQFKRKFILLPPDVNLSVSKTHPLANHHGFEPCLCYGDILLSFSWSSQNAQASRSKIVNSSLSSKNVQDLEKDFIENFEIINNETNKATDNPANTNYIEDSSKRAHDFIRTHFHRSTQCDYCGKKIWLKDAVQCRDCAMCCHKKCVSKCLSSGGTCQPPIGFQQGDNYFSQKPQFLMTEHGDGDSDIQNASSSQQQKSNTSQKSECQKSDENSLGRNTLTGLLGGLRRVGSAHSLSPTSHSGPPSLRSLPPSPQHTSRCQSPDDDLAWTAFEASIERGVKNADDLLRPLVAAQIPPDVLLAKARDSGPRFLAHLPAETRAERISVLIADIKSALDNESAKATELQHNLRAAKDKVERQSSNAELEENEEKIQILTALLLHCCSAMQSVNQTD